MIDLKADIGEVEAWVDVQTWIQMFPDRLGVLIKRWHMLKRGFDESEGGQGLKSWLDDASWPADGGSQPRCLTCHRSKA